MPEHPEPRAAAEAATRAGAPAAATVVLLAGGRSVRFGSDKLAAALGGRDLLTTTLLGLPPGCRVVVVGPPRPLPVAVTWAREHPPGGGPATAVHAGVLALAAHPPGPTGGPVVVLPGDAPHAGLAVEPLVRAAAATPAPGVVGTGPDGRVQHLHLALGEAALTRLLTDPPAPGSSARELVRRLGLVPALLPAQAVLDVDRPQDLAAVAPAAGGPDEPQQDPGAAPR